jgi:hypothetical protein
VPYFEWDLQFITVLLNAAKPKILLGLVIAHDQNKGAWIAKVQYTQLTLADLSSTEFLDVGDIY